ncbi:MAG: hypothetical protein V2A58_01695 [Planctomycetota bacterium]
MDPGSPAEERGEGAGGTPMGFDPERRMRLERFNVGVAVVAAAMILACVVALAHAEVRSARLTGRGWDLLYENPRQAVPVLEEASRLKRTNGRALYGLWQGLFILERFDEAREVAERRVRLDRLSPDAYVELAKTVLGSAEDGGESWAEACRYLSVARLLRPGDFAALEMLLECHVEAGDLQGALETVLTLKHAYLVHLEFCNEVIGGAGTSRKDLATAYNDKAWILATSKIPSLRNREEALLYAKKAIELAGKDPDRDAILDTLAEAYFINGETPLALIAIRKAISLRPERLYYYILQERRFLRAWEGMAT